jgi:hypothetical protein
VVQVRKIKLGTTDVFKTESDRMPIHRSILPEGA